MNALIDGYVLRRETDEGEYEYYSVDECADAEYCFLKADFHTPLKVYLTEEECEGALYEALYLYQKSNMDTLEIENTYVIPYKDCVADIEYHCLEVEEG